MATMRVPQAIAIGPPRSKTVEYRTTLQDHEHIIMTWSSSVSGGANRLHEKLTSTEGPEVIHSDCIQSAVSVTIFILSDEPLQLRLLPY